MFDLDQAIRVAKAAASGDESALRVYLEGMREHWKGGVHMGTTLGAEIVEVARDRVTMRMAWREELQRGGGIFHGGALMALADHVAGFLFNTDPRVFAERKTGLTTDFAASFLRAAAPGEGVVAEGTVLRRGRNVTFMDIRIRAESSGRELAVCRTTYVAVAADRVGSGS